jgi:RNA-directed DNA polymerase
MSDAKTTGSMSPGILKVAERAEREPQGRLLALARLVDVPALERAYGRIRKNAAVGVDGVDKEEYGQGLGERLEDLHGRLRTKRYRHQAIRRVHIPKEAGTTRPIGVSTIEDKVVQEALREVLQAVYEPVFLDCSYGFRPKRSAHDALRSLNRMLFEGEVSWVIEADIRSYFDSIDRTMLLELLRLRIADESLLRLVGKCLCVGVLDGDDYSEPEQGTAQGSVLSPLLGNVYLHHVLDLWLTLEVQPRLRGRMRIVRYADDFVIGFELEQDARRVMAVLGRRFERFGLTLHPDKTRLFRFARPSHRARVCGGQPTFDFLGFTAYWRRGHRGRWAFALKTRKSRQRRALVQVDDWCKRNRCVPLGAQHAALVRKLTGHFNYFAVNGNQQCVTTLWHRTQRSWFKWLRRRSQRSAMTWERMQHLLVRYPLPKPTVRVIVWKVVAR